MKTYGLLTAALAGSLGLLTLTAAARADVAPLDLGYGLPGVLTAYNTDATQQSVVDNSVTGYLPVGVSSVTTTRTDLTTKVTPTTYTYSQTFATAQSADQLSAYINGLTTAQLTAIRTRTATGGASSSTATGTPTNGSPVVVTNAGATPERFSYTYYFHAETPLTALVGGLPGQGGTGVVLQTLTSGVAGSSTRTTTSTGATEIVTSIGAFSAPTTQTVSGGYKYTWTQTVTATATTPKTTKTVVSQTIQNSFATGAAFSDVSFSLLSDANGAQITGETNDAQGSYSAADFTDTVFTTNSLVDSGDPTQQLLAMPNTSTDPNNPTLYPVAYANEYAFVVTGAIAPYSTGVIELSISSVPESTSWAMLALGFLSLGLVGARSKRRRVG